LLYDCYNPFPSDPDFVFDRWLPQIVSFAKDIYPVLEGNVKKYIENFSQCDKISLVDVGGGVGAVTEYFSSRLQRFLAVEMKKDVPVNATIVDTDLRHREFAEHFYPKCQFFAKKIDEIDDKFDFVIASHVIEHIEEDEISDFINTLKQMAKIRCLVYAPYNENMVDHINAQHKTSITLELIESFSPVEIKLINSDGWSLGECILAVYDGAYGID
jgi:SAM-dependent methyltransferase